MASKEDILAAMMALQNMDLNEARKEDPDKSVYLGNNRLHTGRGSIRPGNSSKSEDTSFMVVAAIDFGTTFSGYAFSYKNAPDDIKLNKSWGSSIGFEAYKTPTCVLMTPDKRFQSFGYQAQKEFAALVENQDKEYYFFEWFKMDLHSDKRLTRDTMVTASNGKQVRALKVFGEALRYLKGHLLENLRGSHGGVQQDEIKWVITVPAIWSDKSKQFMREAAFEGGLISKTNSKSLIIALEPEAASLYCRNLEINQFSMHSREEEMSLPTGTKYLVLDAGGGTLDVTVHQVQNDGTVKELHYATGDAYGGIYVDQGYIHIMEGVLGKDFLDIFRKQCASQWLEMMSDFEKKKRACTPEKKESTNLKLLYGLGTKYAEVKDEQLPDAFARSKNKGVKFSPQGMIVLEYKVMEKIFCNITDKIVDHIGNLLRKIKGIKYLFMVGGFSESQMLQHSILNAFKNQVKVMIPQEASLAVVKGAVRFGYNPALISGRQNPKSFGIRLCPDFEPGKHDPKRRVVYDGKAYCTNVFEIFLEKGFDVENGYKKSMTYSPVRANQSVADVNIYSTEDDGVEYVDDPRCTHHCLVQAQWLGHGLDRSIEIEMSFGGTEIEVKAICQPGNEETKATVDFLTDKK